MRLGELLLQSSEITQDQLQLALERQRVWGGRLGANLVKVGAISEDSLLRILSAQTGIAPFDFIHTGVDKAALKLLPRSIAERFNVIPVRIQEDGSLILALSDPLDTTAMDAVHEVSHRTVVPVLAGISAIIAAINAHYPDEVWSKPKRDPDLAKLESRLAESDAHAALPNLAAPQEPPNGQCPQALQSFFQRQPLERRWWALCQTLAATGQLDWHELAKAVESSHEAPKPTQL